MGLNRDCDIDAAQRKTVLALLERHLPNTAAWAYGSRAKWTARPQSDLDMVVFASPEQNGQVSHLREAFEESNLPFRVDLFVWDAVPEKFRRQIEAEHVVLVDGTAILQTRSAWPLVQIGEIAQVVGGSTPSTKDEQNFDGDVPWLTPKDLSGLHDRVVMRGRRNLSRTGLSSCSARLVPPGTVCLSTRAPIGYVAIAGVELATNQGFRNLVLRDGVCSDFIYYWLKANTEKLEQHAVGTTFRELPGSALKRIRIPLPPLPEQRAIARILRALDDKIELNRRMNETLEAMARALFRSWFVDFDPVRAKMAGRDPNLPKPLADLFPDRLDNATGLPVGWQAKPLDGIAEFINGLALQKYPATSHQESLPVIKIAELRNGISSKSNRASFEIPEKYIIKNGDFLFSWSGSLMAKFWTEGEGALNQHLFKVTSEHYPPWFYANWVYRHLEQFQAIAAAKATTMGHIQRSHLRAAMTNCPPHDILVRLDAGISPLIDRLIQNELESCALAMLRDALLPKLILGTLRTTDCVRWF